VREWLNCTQTMQHGIVAPVSHGVERFIESIQPHLTATWKG